MTARRLTWRVREFAARAGTTIKALRHYDRLGLLRPARTPAGHRVYSPADLEQLRRILALKRIGVALAEMPPLLDANREALLAYLGERRDVLRRERERLRRIERALGIVEESLRGHTADEAGLTRLADVIELPHAIGHLKRYFSDEAWMVARRFYQDWPDADWIALCREIEGALPEGPDGPRAGELVARWNDLARRVWLGFACDFRLSRELHEGFSRAWRDRAAWPAPIRRRFEDYRLDDLTAFVRDASIAVFNRRAASA